MALEDLNLQLYATCITVFVIYYVVYQYNRYGLYSVPGPALAALSKLWQLRHAIDGDTEFATKELHDKYGR